MQRDDRIAMYEGVLDLLLTRGREKAYVTFETAGDRDQYVQFQLHGCRVYGEVGSRQWDEPERPLTAAAVARLDALGFTGGGPERNFAKDGLLQSAAEIAELTDALFLAAYDLDDAFSPVVHCLNLNDVTLPRAQQFTRDMIATLLQDRGITYLRDEEGDFRVELAVEGWDQPAILWLIAEGGGDTTYRVSSSMQSHPLTWTREAMLERCNGWNREHRWPKALLIDHDDHFVVATSGDIDLAEGITPALFRSFTDNVVHGTLEFWVWLAAADQPSATDGGRDARGEAS